MVREVACRSARRALLVFNAAINLGDEPEDQGRHKEMPRLTTVSKIAVVNATALCTRLFYNAKSVANHLAQAVSC